jgi:hypothetical protein
VVQDLFARDYLQEAFGYKCVDAGDVPGRLGRDPDIYFIRRLGYPIEPLRASFPRMEPDELFDLIEVLHDLVAEGIQEAGLFHSWNSCGWHFRSFDTSAGQQFFRDQLNPLLERLESPLELTPKGELQMLSPADLRPLLEADLPATAPEADVEHRIDVAVARFRNPRASMDERRAAVRELADILEFIRPDVKTALLPADERALFDIANNFGIRHHNRQQRGDYDSNIWLSWAFYVYLATIHAVLRVKARPSHAQEQVL